LVNSNRGGPGGARNRGVEQARGEFLAFVDADDMLPPHAYEVLLHTLESSGSDFVSGAVNRIGTEGVTPSALHARAIKGRKIGTHVTRAPSCCTTSRSGTSCSAGRSGTPTGSTIPSTWSGRTCSS
jgi:Glycosyltransferases involved in cell wall biogenesis